ncbi:MAG: pyridoxamine 5'-phosphate oxidase [bacterium]
MSFESLRREYIHQGLFRKDLDDNPFTQFNNWLGEAIEGGVDMPNAFSLATTNNTETSIRTVLLKEITGDGFIFFTDYDSKKANDISINNQVGMLFTWLGMDRQIKISGRAEKISKTASLKYFLTRPKDSQIAAFISQQSKKISGRVLLETAFYQAKQKFKNGEVPLPHWGGYKIIPHKMEFWQGRESRLHDSFSYQLLNNSWKISRLNP